MIEMRFKNAKRETKKRERGERGETESKRLKGQKNGPACPFMIKFVCSFYLFVCPENDIGNAVFL